MEKPGVVTAASDSMLAMLHGLVYKPPEDVEFIPTGQLYLRLLTANNVVTRRLVNQAELETIIHGELSELPDNPLRKNVEFPGFISAMHQTLQELRHLSIAPEQFSSIAERLSNPRVTAVSELYERVETAIDTLDRATTMSLRAQLSETPLENKPFERILCFLGDEYRPDLVAALELLSTQGISVTVVQDWAPGQFVPSARSLGTKAKAAEPSHWTQQFFETDVPVADAPEMLVISCSDLLAEVEWVLRQCVTERQRVSESDIAIFAPEARELLPFLISMAERFGVQLSARLPSAVMNNGFAKFFAQLVDALQAPDVRKLLAVAGSSYAAAKPDELEWMKTALGTAMRAETDSWTALDDLVEREHFNAPAFLPEVLEWRRSAVEHPRSLSNWHGMFMKLTQLEVFADAANVDEHEKAKDDRPAQTALLRAVRDLASVEGQEPVPLSLSEAAKLCARKWETTQMYLPSTRYGINVVTDPIQLGDVKVVIAMNSVDGVLPARRREDPILADRQREAINALLPGPKLLVAEDHAHQNRDRFIRLSASASSKLIMSFHRSVDGSERRLSAYGKRLCRIYPVDELVVPIQSLVPEAEDCRIPADLRLRQALDGPREGTLETRLTHAEAIERFALKSGDSVSVRDVVLASECPFRSVVNRHLHFRAPRSPVMSALSTVFRGSGIATAPDEDTARLLLSHKVREVREALSLEVEERELIFFDAAVDRLSDDWIGKEFALRARLQVGSSDIIAPFRLADHPGCQSELRANGKVFPIADTFPVAWKVEDGYLVRPSHAPTEGDAEHMERMLYFTLLLKSMNNALYYERMQSEPLLVVYGEKRHTPYAGMSEAKTVTKADAPHVKRDEVSAYVPTIVRVLKDLQLGTAEAKPGVYCQSCAYGGLCRVSSADYG